MQAGLQALTGAFAVKAIVSGMFSAANAASDLTESITKSRAVFGETRSVAIEAFGDTASAIGLSKRAAVEATGTFGNLFTSMGLGRDAAVGMSLELVKLSADIASFNNLPMEEALLKIRAGLVGEIEPLRTIGVSFNALQVEAKAAALGLTDVNGAVSESAKVQARYALILDLTKNAQGDFARTSGGFANQQRILKAEFENLQATIGERVVPVLLMGVSAIRELLDVFTSLPGPVQTGVVVLGLLGAAGTAVAISMIALRGALAAAGVSATTTAAAMGLLRASLGIAGVVIGIVAALDYFGLTARDTAINVEKLTAATGDELVDGFRKAEDAAFLTGGGLEFFREVVDANREAALRMRDALKAQGEDVRALDRILDDAAAAQAEQAQATGKGGQAASDAASKFAELRKSVSAANDEIEAATSGAIDLGRAEITLRDTVRELGAALGEGAKKGESLVEFQDRLTGGTYDTIEATKNYVLALANAGQITGGAIGIQGALRAALLQVADVFPELRAQIASYLSSLSVMATTTAALINAGANIAGGDVRNRNRQAQVESENFLADQEAQAAATAKGLADQLRKVGEVGRTQGAAVGRKTAEATAKEVERTLRESARPGGGLDLGGFIVEGIQLGERETKIRVGNFMHSLVEGMADVVAEAEKIDPAEQLGILEAVAAVDKAAIDLGETRKKLGANSIEAAIAEGKLQQAQEKVNEVTLDAIDATDAVADAQKRQKEETERLAEEQGRLNKAMRDGLSASLDALSAARGLAAAQRSLRDAQRSLVELQERQTKLPGEVAAAEGRLAVAQAAAAQVTAQESLAIVQARKRVADAEETLAEKRGDSEVSADDLLEAELELIVAQDRLTEATVESTGATREVADAERDLADLRKEAATVADDLTSATVRVTDAELALVDAQLALIDAGKELTGSQDEIEAFFRGIATQAGLSTAAIEGLLDAMRRAKSATGSPSLGGATGGTASGHFQGMFGGLLPHEQQQVLQSIGYDISKAVENQSDAVKAAVGFNPFVDHANQTADVQALVGLQNQGFAPIIGAGGGGGGTTITANIFPKEAVYDDKATVTTLKQLELLS